MEKKEEYSEFDPKELFVPLTSIKAFFIILTIGVILFSNSLFNNFIGDDRGQILENIPIHSSNNIPRFFSGGTFYNSGSQKLVGVYYKPLLNSTFSVIYDLFGPKAFAFHIFQMTLHIMNAFLLFLLFKILFAKPLSLVLSLIFLVHPINSEAVFHISAMQEPLFSLFGLLALYGLSKTKSNRGIIVVSFLLFLSVLSKETGGLFFPIAIIFAFFYKRKFFWPTVSFLILPVFFYLFLRISSIGIFTRPGNAPIALMDLADRILNIPAILIFYLKTFFFPINLASSYHWLVKQLNFNNFVLPFILVFFFSIAITFFGYILLKNERNKDLRIYLFFLAWFTLGIIMHLQLFPLDATVAERWFYFPIIGLLGMIGVLASKSRTKWFLGILMIAVMLLGVRTFIRSFDWRNNLRLASHDIKVSPDSYALESLLAASLADKGKLGEAKIHAEKSIQLYPYINNYLNLGYIYYSMGEFQKAREAYLKSLEFGDYYRAYEGLAAVSVFWGDPSENIEFVKSALEKFPKSSRLWLNLAILNYKIGNIDEAKNLAEKAYSYSRDPVTLSFYKKIMSETLDFNFK